MKPNRKELRKKLWKEQDEHPEEMVDVHVSKCMANDRVLVSERE